MFWFSQIKLAFFALGDLIVKTYQEPSLQKPEVVC